jgi:hypothetical protein
MVGFVVLRAFAASTWPCSAFRQSSLNLFSSVGGMDELGWVYDVRRMSGVGIASVGRLRARASNCSTTILFSLSRELLCLADHDGVLCCVPNHTALCSSLVFSPRQRVHRVVVVICAVSCVPIGSIVEIVLPRHTGFWSLSRMRYKMRAVISVTVSPNKASISARIRMTFETTSVFISPSD